MSGDLKCPSCERWGFSAWEQSCTGRAGCVQHPNRENPAPEKPPAGANVPVGTTDIVERLLMHEEPYYESSLKINGSLRDDIEKAAAEIARLRAEVERLQADRAALAQRVVEAVREAIRECQPSVSRHQWMSDEACTRAEAIEEWRKDIDAIDIAAIVAAVLAKEGK
jgi:hypothetical protein